jgi:hypothetical protein
MDPTLDPFAEPPRNPREYLGEELAAALEAKAKQQANSTEGCIVELYGGALDGAEAIVPPGCEFAPFANGTLAYRFCAKLTVKRGRETWVPVIIPPLQDLFAQ